MAYLVQPLPVANTLVRRGTFTGNLPAPIALPAPPPPAPPTTGQLWPRSTP